jgi:hypothetical protein
MKNSAPRFLTLLAAVLVSLLCLPALARAQAGAVSGSVVASAGSPIAGVTVSARNLATGFRGSAVSDPSGAFRIEGLPEGSYDVTAEASGYGTGISRDVVVHGGEFTHVAFALEPISPAAAPSAIVMSESPQEPQGQAGEPPPNPMKQGPRMQIYGFVMLDLINDFDQINPDWFDVERPTKLPAFPNEFGDNGNFWASVRQTRFGVRGWLPTGWGEVKTEFEFDLFGVGADAGQTTIRLRQAWGSLGPVLAGQTNSVFMDGDVFPNVVEYWGPNGMVFFRNVQLRWTPIDGKGQLAIAIERPGASADSGQFADRIEIQNIRGHFPYPDVTAHYKYGDDWGHVQLAGIFRYMGWTDTLQDQFDLSGHAIGWGVNGSAVLKITKRGTLRLEATYGHGIENYMNDAPVDVAAQSNPGNPVTPVTGKALPIFGMVAYYDISWSDKFSTAIGYSRLDISNGTEQLPAAFKSGQYASTNLLWYPVKNVMTGIEFQWGRRQNFTDGFAANDFRLQFSAQYKFNFDLGGKP